MGAPIVATLPRTMAATTSARFAVPKDVHYRRFDNEVVVLDLGAGKYFALDEIGSQVWDRLAAGKAVDQIVADLVALYDTDEATARADVNRLAEELVAAGLMGRL